MSDTTRVQELLLIETAFSKLDEYKGRFLQNERAYRSRYEKGTDGEAKRTRRRKAADRTRSRLYIPLTKTTVNIIHALFQTSFMSASCPIDIESIGQKSDHDDRLKNAIMAATKRAWKAPNHRIGLSKAVLSAIMQPLGIVMLFMDKQRNEIRSRYIPITDLAFDELATDIGDLEHVCYEWRQSVREFKDKVNSKFYKLDPNNALPYTENALDSERVKMQDIYMRFSKNGKQKWKLKSFCNSVLVREAEFAYLPFHFGYCLEDLPSIEIDERLNELQMYGTSIPEVVREIQSEYNIKRNQKIDITENQIDPIYALDNNAGNVAINDLSTRKKYVRVSTAQGKNVSDVITPLSEPGTYGISEEIQMLDAEYQQATGVNSILTGHTSPSDRRAMGALQTVNAASSMRIESMIQTLQSTMLNTYAQHFVHLVYLNTPDEEFIELMEDENIIDVVGKKGQRKSLRFDVNINFGTTIGNEAKMAQLNALLQTLAQTGNNKPEIVDKIVEKIMVLILGETADTEAIEQKQGKPEMTPEQKNAAALAKGGV